MTSLKSTSSPTVRRAVVAIVAASLGLATLTPAAFAAGPDDGRQMHRFGGGADMDKGKGWRQGRDNTGDHARGQGRDRNRAEGRHQGRMGQQGGRGGMMFGFGCGPNAAERIEHALVSLTYRIDPTDAQAGLVEDLKTTALDAQTQYAAVCEAVMPQRGADASAPQSNILEMMQSRLQLEQARVTALGDILPKFEALYDTLSDEQKASLQPRGMRGKGRGMGAGPGAAPAPEAAAPAEPQNG
jgi:hypothetical protein